MKSKRGGLFMIALVILIILVVAVVWFVRNMNVETKVNIDFTRKVENTTNNSDNSTAELANPASEKCLEDGYKLKRIISLNEGEYAVCIDVDEKECEEWAYFYGRCTLGEPFD